MKTVIFIFSLIITFVSCTEQVAQVEQTFNAVNLNGELVKKQSENASQFTRWIVGDLAISESGAAKRGYYGSLLENNIMKKTEPVFSVGHGHNEFERIMLGKGQDSTILLLNIPLNGNKFISLTAVGLSDSIADIRDYNSWKKYDVSKLPAFSYGGNDVVSLSDSTLLVIGAPYNAIGHIFSIMDYKNQKILPLKFWPNDGTNCDSLITHRVYTDEAKIMSNGKDRFLYQCDREKYAFIFSIEGDKVNVTKELYSVYPEYKKSNDGYNYIQKNRTPEDLHCTASSKNIYILFKEFDHEGNKKEKWDSPLVYGDIVEVYDWNGNKKNTFHLDKIGGRIIISEDNKTLYLFEDRYDEDGNSNIWAYNLAESNI